jgi:hypothetical protein
MIMQVLSRTAPQHPKNATTNTMHPMAISKYAGVKNLSPRKESKWLKIAWMVVPITIINIPDICEQTQHLLVSKTHICPKKFPVINRK